MPRQKVAFPRIKIEKNIPKKIEKKTPYKSRRFVQEMLDQQPRPYRVKVSHVACGKLLKILEYSGVEYGKDEFVDASMFVPWEFDLCDLKTDKGTIIPGWWNGSCFYSCKLKNSNTKILFWKKHREAH
jgi:hypothetical protein